MSHANGRWLRRVRNRLTGGDRIQSLLRSSLRRRRFRRFRRYFQPMGPHLVRAPSGATFIYVADADDVMAREVVWPDVLSWEETTVRVLWELCSRADRFWDLGAYAGVYTLLACAANPNLAAVAVEPVPSHADWLRRNLQVNGLLGRVTVWEAAVTSAPGPVSLNLVHSDPTASGLNVDRPGTSVHVDACELEHLGPAPDVIKIDVEGHEVDALETGSELIRARRPNIVAECLNMEALRRLRGLLEPMGYSVYHLGARAIRPAAGLAAVPTREANFLATADGVGRDCLRAVEAEMMQSTGKGSPCA